MNFWLYLFLSCIIAIPLSIIYTDFLRCIIIYIDSLLPTEKPFEKLASVILNILNPIKKTLKLCINRFSHIVGSYSKNEEDTNGQSSHSKPDYEPMRSALLISEMRVDSYQDKNYRNTRYYTNDYPVWVQPVALLITFISRHTRIIPKLKKCINTKRGEPKICKTVVICNTPFFNILPVIPSDDLANYFYFFIFSLPKSELRK